jgi:hypothetical protein
VSAAATSGWRAVPMPSGVARLPRTPGGLPVPYVASWSSEQGKPSLRPEPRLERIGFDGPATYYGGAVGVGRPVLGEMQPERQREVTLEQLCQVCHGPAHPRAIRKQEPPFDHPLLLADIRIASSAPDAVGALGDSLLVDGKPRPLIFEPWVCPPCLRYALLVCPGLIRRSGAPHDGERFFRPLRVLRVRDARPVAVTARLDDLGGAIAVAYVKLAVLACQPQTPEEFLGCTGGVPAAWRPLEASA